MENKIKTRISLTRSPLRISLAGGGTDLFSYASRFEGAVLSLAINRYVSIAMYPRSFDEKICATWEYLESALSSSVLKNAFGKAALARMGIDKNIQISTFSDVPSGTGLGGSGAFLVSLLHAGNRDIFNNEDRYELAEEASAIEMSDLNLPVGKQDHYMAALGGLQLLKFRRDLSVEVCTLQPGPRCSNYFSDRLLLFYTGERREAANILKTQSENTENGKEETLNSLHTIYSLVAPMLAAINEDNPDLIGPLLDRHWKQKSRLNKKIKVDRIDQLYNLAMSNGADGGKLLGAGGGGFLLLSAKDGYENQIRKVMAAANIQELTFGIDLQGTIKTYLPI